jgi:glutamine synthetase adenylyltransferase
MTTTEELEEQKAKVLAAMSLDPNDKYSQIRNRQLVEQFMEYVGTAAIEREHERITLLRHTIFATPLMVQHPDALFPALKRKPSVTRLLFKVIEKGRLVCRMIREQYAGLDDDVWALEDALGVLDDVFFNQENP